MKYLWVIALFCLVLGLTLSLDRSMPTEESCVLVYSKEGHGSGAIVEPNCILTAKHIADMNDLIIRTFGGEEYKVVKIVRDPDSDMARLYVGGRFKERILPIDKTPFHVGDEVTVIGTPGEKWLQGCVLRGRVVKVDAKLPDGNPYITYPQSNLDILDCHADRGCSGGPVIDKNGHIRGIFTLVLGTRLVGAVSLEELDI